MSAELTETLGLHRCTYETPPFTGAYAGSSRQDSSPGRTSSRHKQGSNLPHEGVELPVAVRDQAVARFVLIPRPGHGVSSKPGSSP